MFSINDQVINSFQVIKEMLTDRGIDISSIEKIGPKELEGLSSSQSIFSIEISPTLVIIYYMTKMKINEFKNAMFGKSKDIEGDIVDKNNGKMHIFVFKDEISAQNSKNINELFDTFQTFHVKDLMFNVTKHAFVPKHAVIRDPVELEKIFKTYNIKSKAQLPCIHQTDPVAKYYAMQPGEVVKIERPSLTCGIDYYFRVCIP